MSHPAHHGHPTGVVGGSAGDAGCVEGGFAVIVGVAVGGLHVGVEAGDISGHLGGVVVGISDHLAGLAERGAAHACAGRESAGVGVDGDLGSGEAGAEVGLGEAGVGALTEDVADEAEAVLAVGDQHLVGRSGEVAAVGLALAGEGVAVEDFGGEGSCAGAETTGGHTGAGGLLGHALLLGRERAAELEFREGLAVKFALDVRSFQVSGGGVAEVVSVVGDGLEVVGLLPCGNELIGGALGVEVLGRLCR